MAHNHTKTAQKKIFKKSDLSDFYQLITVPCDASKIEKKSVQQILRSKRAQFLATFMQNVSIWPKGGFSGKFLSTFVPFHNDKFENNP